MLIPEYLGVPYLFVFQLPSLCLFLSKSQQTWNSIVSLSIDMLMSSVAPLPFKQANAEHNM